MQKREFIKKLKGELQWYLSTAELRTILQEYEGYFATAAANGSDEATAAAELGAPALVAAEILSEHPNRVVRLKHEKARLILALILLMSSAAVALFYPTWSWEWTYRTGIARFWVGNYLQFILPTLIALLVGLGRAERLDPPHVGTLFGINLIATGALWTMWYNIFYMPIISTIYFPTNGKIPFLWWIVTPDTVGPTVSFCCTIFSLITLTFTLMSIWQIVSGRLIYISLLYLNCSTIYGLYDYQKLLHIMIDPSSLPGEMGAVIPYVAFGFLVSAVIATAIFLHRKRVSV